MKVYLIKADINPEACLSQAEEITQGIVGIGLEAEVRGSIVDNDLFICDLALLQGNHIDLMVANRRHIANRIKNGGVLLCFSGKINRFSKSGTRWTNYSWIYGVKEWYQPENLSGNDFNFYGTEPFIASLSEVVKDFEFDCIFHEKTHNAIFSEIGRNKGGNCVALYGSYEEGHIFILPRPTSKEKFIEYFVERILSTFSLRFEISSGSKESMPEEIKKLKVTGEGTLKDKIEKQSEKIKQEKEKMSKLSIQQKNLQKWKDLLWQTGIPLENIVKSFFDLLELKLKKQNIDLVGEYQGKEVFMEVKGNTGCINHKKDFRQIEERKHYDSKDPQNTLALLVGNPFRLLPLAERPPSKAQSLFAKTSMGIAKDSKIGLIPTMELYKIVNDILDKKKKIDKKKILKEILCSYGVYSYTQAIKQEATNKQETKS